MLQLEYSKIIFRNKRGCKRHLLIKDRKMFYTFNKDIQKYYSYRHKEIEVTKIKFWNCTIYRENIAQMSYVNNLDILRKM